MTDVYHHVQDSFLALHRSNGVNFIECILLQYNEINQLRLPENDMIFYRHTVITQDVDLLGNFLTTLQTRFDLIHFTDPFVVDVFGNVCLKFRIFDIFRIRVDRIHSRIALLIGTILLQRIETTSYLFSIFSHRFLQVTSGRRYRTDKGNRTTLTVIQFYITCTTVEVRND